MTERDDIMEQLKAKMKERGINRRKLAAELGLEYSAMSKWFDGKSYPKRPAEKVLENWIKDGNWKNVPHGTIEKSSQTPPVPHDYKKEYDDLLNRFWKLSDTLEECRSEIKRLQLSLNSILDNQDSGIDTLEELLFRDWNREAKGNPKMVAQLQDDFVKRRGVHVGLVSKRGKRGNEGTGGK